MKSGFFKFLALVLAFLIYSGPVFAKPDVAMSCVEIETELDSLDKIIGAEGGAQAQAQVASAGTAAATQAAIMGGSAAKSLPLVGGVGNAFSGLANMRRQKAEKAAQNAQLRKNTLEGLYMGKGCGQETVQAAAAPQDVAPMAVQAQATKK